jgi:hypothetical protein
VPFLSLGRAVPGPGEEYGEEDYVLLLDVFGDMAKRKSKPSSKPSLPSPAGAKGAKQGQELVLFEARASNDEKEDKGLNRQRERGERWADWIEADEAEIAREKAQLAEERERWRASQQEEEVLNLDAPTGKTVLELLAEREVQDQRQQPPTSKASPLGEGLVKTASSSAFVPYVKKGKESKGGPDAAMEMALRVKDPAIQATLTRTLTKTRLGATEPHAGDSTTEDEEEPGDTKEERAKKERESTKKKHSKGKGTKRADSQASGKDAGRKIKRGREEEVKRKGVEEELESAHDLEMTDVMDLPTEQPTEEMEPLKGEKEVGLEKPRAEKKIQRGRQKRNV